MVFIVSKKYMHDSVSASGAALSEVAAGCVDDMRVVVNREDAD